MLADLDPYTCTTNITNHEKETLWELLYTLLQEENSSLVALFLHNKTVRLLSMTIEIHPGLHDIAQ